MNKTYSIVIPAYNEENAIGTMLGELLALKLPAAFEVIVVDDHSSDATASVAEKFPVRLLRNVQNFGYGYSLKRGISASVNGNIVILDADGSYPVSLIPMLIAEYEKGYDMVVGARHGTYYRGSFAKRV